MNGNGRVMLVAVILGGWVCVALGQSTVAEPTSQPAVTESKPADLISIVGEGGRLYQTEHYVMASNVPDALATRIDDLMEEAYGQGLALCRMLRIEPLPLNQRLELILFNYFEQYLHFAREAGTNGEGTAGFYDSGNNRSAFYNVFNDDTVREYNDKIDQLEQSDSSMKRRVKRLRRELNVQARAVLETAMRHELAHQVQHNVGILNRGVVMPMWLVEGLACLYEVDTTRARRGLVVNTHRLDRYRKAEKAGALLPLERLMATQRPDAATQAEEAEVFYAESWALCYYLVRYRPKQVAAYLAVLRQREPGVRVDGGQERRDFEGVFGATERVERAFFRAIKRVRGSGR